MNIQHEHSESQRASGRVLAWAVSALDGVDLRVRKGDVVRSCVGTVWLTFEGHLRDIVLAPGESYRVEFDARAMITGFGAAKVQIDAASAALARAGLSDWRWSARRSVAIEMRPCAAA